MDVVPESQRTISTGVRRSFSYGKPNVERFASKARATGPARASARRWASWNFTGSYELYSPIVIRPGGTPPRARTGHLTLRIPLAEVLQESRHPRLEWTRSSTPS